MESKKLKHFKPMSESMLLILISLKNENHGYGIMKFIIEKTNGCVKLGAGTIYQTLSKLEHSKLIRHTENVDRQKKYEITEKGNKVLEYEILRLKNIIAIAEEIE